VTGGCRKVHNEELRDVNSSASIIRGINSGDVNSSASIIRGINSRRMKWARHVRRMGKKNACRLFIRKPGGKIPPGRQWRRWVDNIKMDLGEIG
jgi:hypothetical protein